MKERIRQIIDNENISYSKFADVIGIQRSGVSHILSGRNNPSLEVVQKILETFTYVNTDWLLFGIGQMKKEIKQGNLFNDSPVNTEISDNTKTINAEEKNENSNSKAFFKENFESDKIKDSNDVKNISNEIEKIVIFYRDNTMKAYSPRDD